MKNNFIYFVYIILINFSLYSFANGSEIFNFDVTEIEIKENGNKFIGKRGGVAKSADGITIKAINFNYDKSKNILIAVGNVEVNDKDDDVTIYADKITYFKNKEFVTTNGNSKAISKNIEIYSDKFNYNKNTNILNAIGSVVINNKKEDYFINSDFINYNKNQEKIYTKGNSKAFTNNEDIIITGDDFSFDRLSDTLQATGNVKIDDRKEDYILYSSDITYKKNSNQIFTKGKTDAIVQNKYKFNSRDVFLDRQVKEIKSNKYSIIEDNNSNIYKLSRFLYFYETKFLKGENLEITTNTLSEKSDKFYFDSAFIDFDKNSFDSKDTKVLLHKKLFDKERDFKKKDENDQFSGQNDPRIYGTSSRGNENEIIIEKGIFTSTYIKGSRSHTPPLRSVLLKYQDYYR